MTSSGGDPCRATPVDEQSEPQLALLARLAILLSSRRIRFWLRGGWGIDFLLGQITRTHADLALVQAAVNTSVVSRTMACPDRST